MRVSEELRAIWQSLAEVEDGMPGHDYDRGYPTGWYDVRRHIIRRLPRGLFRDPERIEEFRLGYRQGKEDGGGRLTDWWPDHALGRIDPSIEYPAQAIPGTGEPVRLMLVANAERLKRDMALAAPMTPDVVSGPISTPDGAGTRPKRRHRQDEGTAA